MLNFTTEEEGQPGAVLVRALEPVEGVEEMARNRGVSEVGRLTNGPGKLTKALSIDGSFNGEDLVKSRRLYVLDREEPVRVRASARIGISKGTGAAVAILRRGEPVRLEDESPPKMRARSREFVIFLFGRQKAVRGSC